ncbi:hypothetical protein SLEP1_g33191 [Rubroshorea leprosula]|uniref:RING-type E3 ubiquitin transferase n=1 Tax=Rubroshorea leprosula TaxID=152421 RepID=A0AAV5KFV1_9ROSI|nr:hypothetical protein SLEP1_g33191 [Rubroshorea leprosula]
MGFDHRKLLQANSFKCDNYRYCNESQNPYGICVRSCLSICPEFCKNFPGRLPPPRPEGLPPPPFGTENHLLRTVMYIVTCLIGGLLLCAIFCTLIRMYYFRRNNRRRIEGIIFDIQEDFLDEDRGPPIDNPFWNINTVGLPQSVVDSITVFKYGKDEGLIDGTDCSVCLSEFQEDESLRLLPKCSHAFHIPCIDTWLRSHKNCPLCRAPVVCDAIVDRASVSESHVNHSGSSEETLVGNSENYELGSNDVGEGGDGERVTTDGNLGTFPTEAKSTAGSSERSLPHSKSTRVLSDLAGNRQVVEEDMQPMRRSVSLGSFSAVMVYGAVAGLKQCEHQENSETGPVKVKNTKSKVVSGSSSKGKMIKSPSVGPSVSKGPISVKRCLSSGGKFLLRRDNRSEDSILPLET